MTTEFDYDSLGDHTAALVEDIEECKHTFRDCQLNKGAVHAGLIMGLVIETPRIFVITIDKIKHKLATAHDIDQQNDDYIRRIMNSLVTVGWLDQTNRGWVISRRIADAAPKCRELLHQTAMNAEREIVDRHAEPELNHD